MQDRRNQSRTGDTSCILTQILTQYNSDLTLVLCRLPFNQTAGHMTICLTHNHLVPEITLRQWLKFKKKKKTSRYFCSDQEASRTPDTGSEILFLPLCGADWTPQPLLNRSVAAGQKAVKGCGVKVVDIVSLSTGNYHTWSDLLIQWLVVWIHSRYFTVLRFLSVWHGNHIKGAFNVKIFLLNTFCSLFFSKVPLHVQRHTRAFCTLAKCNTFHRCGFKEYWQLRTMFVSTRTTF